MNDSNNGLILVFDLDQTLVATNKHIRQHFTRKRGFYRESWMPKKKPELNPELVEVLRIALEKKKSGEVYAIFLLTNNSDSIFLRNVVRTLEKKLLTKYLFDSMLTAEVNEPRDTPRGKPLNFSSKSIRDIYRLLDRMEKTTDAEKRYEKEELLKRVVFFDDNPDHVIRREMFVAGVPKQYITISPPFMGISETKYGQVFKILQTTIPTFFSFQTLARSVKNVFRKTRKVKKHN